MNQLTHQMSEAVSEQKRGGEMVVKAVEAIAVVSRQNLVAVEQMSWRREESGRRVRRPEAARRAAFRYDRLHARLPRSGSPRWRRQPEGPGAEAAILAALEDPAASVRERAIKLAARYLEPPVLGALVADGENAVRRNAGLSALERQGPYAVPHLVGMLGGQDPELLLFALQSLSRIGHAAAAPAILPLLEHPDPNVAQAAIEAAGKLRIQEAVPPLCGLLQRDLWLQLAAIAALGDIGHPDAVKPLMAFVPDSILAEPAVQALRRIAAPESLEPLVPLLFSVRERSLRDPLLLAVAVVIDLHPDPEPMLRRMERDVVVDGGNLATYLGQLLEAPPGEGDADESDSLLRAAATVVAAAGIAELQPVLLARLARDAASQWIEGLFDPLPRAPHRSARRAPPAPRSGRALWRALGSAPSPPVTSPPSSATSRTRTCLCARPRATPWGAWDWMPPRRCCWSGSGTGSHRNRRRRRTVSRGSRPRCSASSTDAWSRAPPRRSSWKRSACWPALPCPGLEPRVLALAESRSPGIRLAALRATSRVPGSRAEVVLMRALADRHAPIQAEALDLLVRRGGEKSVTTLVAMLGTADSLRFHVIRALGHCRAPSAAVRLRDSTPVRAPRAAADRLLAAPDRAGVAPAVPAAPTGVARPRHAPRRGAGVGRGRGARAPAGTARAGGGRRLGHPPLRGPRPRPAADGGDARPAAHAGARRGVRGGGHGAGRAGAVAGRRLQCGVSPFPAADLKLLGDLIQERFGLTFEGVRQEILAARLGPRLRELHLDSPRAYYEYLRFHPQRDAEFARLPALVTNNETYFFRETRQFEILVDHVVPERRAGPPGRPLRLLSAGCSSGEEPYSVAIALQNAGHAPGRVWEMDACDLNVERIARAKEAVYEEGSLRACDADARRRYFSQEGARFRLRDRYRAGIRFFQANLLSPGSPSSGAPMTPCSVATS